MSMKVFEAKPRLIIAFIIVAVALLYFVFKLTYSPRYESLHAIKLEDGLPRHPYATGAIPTPGLEERLRKGETIDENSSKLAELIRFKYIAKAKPDLPYNLQNEQKTDFSRGQSLFIEETLGSKVRRFQFSTFICFIYLIGILPNAGQFVSLNTSSVASIKTLVHSQAAIMPSHAVKTRKKASKPGT